MSSNCSSPSPPASSSLKALAPSHAEAPEVREEMEIESSSATANIQTGTSLDMSAFQFQNNSAFQTLLSSGFMGAATAGAAAQSLIPMKQELPDSVKQEPVDQPSSSTSIDIAALRNNPAFQSLLLSNGFQTDAANVSLAKLFGAGLMKGDGWQPAESESPKRSRLKVFANGYFMTFDKVSSCQKKHFWRCEYKNTCKARMHTDILTDSISNPNIPQNPMDQSFNILTFIHEHNHSQPSEDEIRHYGLDPARVLTNQVYLVRNTADPNQRRKIRKQAAEREAAIKKIEEDRQREEESNHTVAAIVAARVAVHAASKSNTILHANGGMPSGAMPANQALPLLGQLSFLPNGLPTFAKDVGPATVSPNLSSTSSSSQPTSLLAIASSTVPTNGAPLEAMRGPVKRRQTASPDDDDAWTRDPMFEPTFELARKLRKLWKGEPSRYPRTVPNATSHFEFYISKNDGYNEHLYVPIRIEKRDEAHLKEALQEFSGQKCIGMFVFTITPQINVMFNQPMLSTWDNNQFFLLDDSNPSRWCLMYVDEKAT